MHSTKAFFNLIRWPNLIFFAITQAMFSFCITQPAFSNASTQPNINNYWLSLIIISSVFIAAAGYIINDYFDLNIDYVNKPNKVYVGNIINKRYAIISHLSLSIIGIIIGFYIDYSLFNFPIVGGSHALVAFVLFLYSANFKKQFLFGNIIVSLLTAWSIAILTICEFNHFNITNPISANGLNQSRLVKLTFLYTGFAFIISLIREVIKDMEDIDGDRRYGCKTMPIVWGINATKVFVAVWVIVLVAVLVICQLYVIQFKWWLSIAYCIVTLIIPLMIVLKGLKKAQTAQHFHTLSSNVKKIMLAGIVSMVFFWWYN